VELIEHHTITRLHDDPADEWGRAVIRADCRTAAQAWADCEGLPISISEYETRTEVGVRFSVVVATAEASPAGTLFRWRWSFRWRAWLDRFAALRRAEQYAPAHPVAPGAEMLEFRDPTRCEEGSV
jgi:hypothetical protein